MKKDGIEKKAPSPKDLYNSDIRVLVPDNQAAVVCDAMRCDAFCVMFLCSSYIESIDQAIDAIE